MTFRGMRSEKIKRWNPCDVGNRHIWRNLERVWYECVVGPLRLLMKLLAAPSPFALVVPFSLAQHTLRVQSKIGRLVVLRNVGQSTRNWERRDDSGLQQVLNLSRHDGLPKPALARRQLTSTHGTSMVKSKTLGMSRFSSSGRAPD